MASNYNLYRISSTRELSRRHDNAAADRNMSVVYGGITYDAAIKDPVAAVASESESEPLSRDVRGAIGKVAYLPATKVEAESIADILGKEGKGTTIRLVTGAEGTETSFKALNGQQLRIAHISTHGFYDKSHAKASDNPAMFILEQQDTEDKALARSGLLFAGASNTLQGKKAANGTDDGILTAQEISAIDLRGLNLVALSACQTAQGEIRGDGVFGLQRGFKKAGANTILMSLWKVDDEATCLLMTEFYRNWIVKGKTKHDALEQAKQTVRSHKEKGWNHPQYWAAFILLDGLD